MAIFSEPWWWRSCGLSAFIEPWNARVRLFSTFAPLYDETNLKMHMHVFLLSRRHLMRHEQGFLLLQSARTERPGRLSTNGAHQGLMSGCESFEKYRLTWQELMATILVSLRTICKALYELWHNAYYAITTHSVLRIMPQYIVLVRTLASSKESPLLSSSPTSRY